MDWDRPQMLLIAALVFSVVFSACRSTDRVGTQTSERNLPDPMMTCSDGTALDSLKQIIKRQPEGPIRVELTISDTTIHRGDSLLIVPILENVSSDPVKIFHDSPMAINQFFLSCNTTRMKETIDFEASATPYTLAPEGQLFAWSDAAGLHDFALRYLHYIFDRPGIYHVAAMAPFALVDEEGEWHSQKLWSEPVRIVVH